MGHHPVRAATILLAVACGCLPAVSPLAEETASLPYRIVYQGLKGEEIIKGLDKLMYEMGIASNLEGVAPMDIRITLDDGTKIHEFVPDEHGKVDFPLRPDWNDADLQLRTNQPPGSISFHFGVAARPLTSTRLHYRELMDIRRQFDRAFSGALAGFPLDEGAGPPPRIDAIVVAFGAGASARLIILAAGGEQVYKADPDGSVLLGEDPLLWAEDPVVVLDQVPVSVLPAMQGSATSRERPQ